MGFSFQPQPLGTPERTHKPEILNQPFTNIYNILTDWAHSMCVQLEISKSLEKYVRLT